MRRPILITVLIIVFLALVAGAYWFVVQQGKASWPWVSKTTTTTTTQTNTTNTVTPKNVSLPTEVKGDTAVTGTLKAGTKTITISSQQKYATFNGSAVVSGKTYLVVYFDAVAPADALAIQSQIQSVSLSDGTTTYPLMYLKIASTTVKNDRGFFEYLIPTDAKNLQLQLGTDATKQTVTIK